MSSSDDSDFDSEQEKELRDLEAEGQKIINNLLPAKSFAKYDLVYTTFMKWCNDSKINHYTENVLLVYFNGLLTKYKPSTLWSQWSMLKTTLQLRHSINLNDFHNLKSLLKNHSKGHKPKKSKVFTLAQIKSFLDGSDDTLYLAMKVVLIFGVCGALRCQELCNLDVKDVEDTGTQLIVSVKDSKTYYPRCFVVGSEYYNVVQKYTSSRPTSIESSRFFLAYRSGKCMLQVMGKNKIGEVPKTIALYLNLEDADKYTGHAFRRTGATLLSHSGANLVDVKSLGGWKSDAVAQGYIENSVARKHNIYQGIMGDSSKSSNIPVTTVSSDQSSNAVKLVSEVKSNQVCEVVEEDIFRLVENESSEANEVHNSINLQNPSKKRKISNFHVDNNKEISDDLLRTSNLTFNTCEFKQFIVHNCSCKCSTNSSNN